MRQDGRMTHMGHGKQLGTERSGTGLMEFTVLVPTSHSEVFQLRSRKGLLFCSWLRAIAVCAVFIGALVPKNAFSATITWTGGTLSWDTPTNWSSGAVPGAGDTALFNSIGADITINMGDTVKSITFTSSGLGSFTISGGPLSLSNSGVINIANSAPASTVTETFTAPLTLVGATGGGAYTLKDSDAGGSTFDFEGGITGSAAANKTVTLTLDGAAGTHIGTNIINGGIADGSNGGNLALKTTGGIWSLNGSSLYSGGTTITAGQIIANAGGALGSGNISLSGGTLLLNVSTVTTSANNVTMNGGTLALQSSASSFSESLGTLTLSSNSTIDFANATGSTILFSGLAASPSGILTVDNWSSSDTLAFSSNSGLASFAAGNVQFDINGLDVGGTVLNLGGGEYAIVAAIPEPHTVAAGVGLLAFIFWKERRRIAGLASLLKRPLAS